MTRLPQVLINVRGVDKSALAAATKVWDAVSATEERLGAFGRVLLRPSGTEPLVRVMVEARTGEDAQHHAELLADVVRAALPAA
jgi:phosphoglucosamine mutase